ncbi:MAG TPA: GNAT family protein [Kribbella sp.]
MRAKTRAVVDQFWAKLFGLTAEELHRPGTTAVQHAGLGDYPGIYVLMLGRSVIVSSPDEPSGEFTQVLGPSVHAYLDTVPDHRVDGLREAAYGELGRLREVCGEAQWEESGFAEKPERCFVVDLDRQIVAASNLTPWRGAPADVGVLVDPAFAGRGLGTGVAAAAAADAVRTAGMARYRALETNTASLRIATRLGFTPYGRNLALKPQKTG